MTAWNWKDRLRAAGIHLGISVSIALFAALLVFGEWYPYPYREISGGRELFTILISVDVVMGPLITLMIFNRAKRWAELRRDLAIVGLLQLAALAYGMWTVSLARPVHLVFEFDRFRVVHAIEVPEELLDKTPPGITALPLLGPTMLSVREFKDNKEKIDATMVALQGGASLSARPDLWEPYEAALPRLQQEARSAQQLKSRFPQNAAEIDAVLAGAGRKADSTGYLPMIGRKSFWTAFIDPPTGKVVAFMPLDSF